MQTPELTACQSHADEFERAAELALRQNQPLFAKELASHANYLRGQAEQMQAGTFPPQGLFKGGPTTNPERWN